MFGWSHHFVSLYTMFHKKNPFFFLSYFTQMMINLHEIFASCSWRNTFDWIRKERKRVLFMKHCVHIRASVIMYMVWYMVLSAAARNVTSQQKCMDLSKPNVNIVFSRLVKWPINLSWIILAHLYMWVCRSLLFSSCMKTVSYNNYLWCKKDVFYYYALPCLYFWT